MAQKWSLQKLLADEETCILVGHGKRRTEARKQDLFAKLMSAVYFNVILPFHYQITVGR